mgnify:CR=1 FL=1
MLVTLVAACGAGDDTPAGESDTLTVADGSVADAADACESDGPCYACTTAADCPAATGECVEAVCTEAGICAPAPVADGTACDDGDHCSAEDACASGVCASGPCACRQNDECAALEDGDLCNGTLFCDKSASPWTCLVLEPTIVTCPAVDTACRQAACDPKTGTCVEVPGGEGASCDDGDPCTETANCADGACVGGPDACECKETADCASKDDGDLCNGKHFCDKSKEPWQCAIAPASIVTCSDTDLDDCAGVVCVPASGACTATNLDDGTPCNADGHGCTEDACSGGSCALGPVQGCACMVDTDCLAYDDGDLCNGVPFCNQVEGHCAPNPASIVFCATATDGPCEETACVAASGDCALTPRPNGSACDDGIPCTSDESCKNGACTFTQTSCVCIGDADCAALEDGDLCNGTLYCDLASYTCVINPATPVVCATGDDTECLAATCLPDAGTCTMAPAADGKICDADGLVCSESDACDDGVCVAGGWVCDCKVDADCADVDDGDPCNGTLYCSLPAGTCETNPATVVTCSDSDDTVCSKSTCSAQTATCGFVPVAEGSPCDLDGFACTQDTCKAGACAASGQGCVCTNDADCGPFDDGDACNGTLYCDLGDQACVINPATLVQCPTAEDSVCAKSTCAPASGACSLTPFDNGTPCTDGNTCTAKEACKSGVCQGGTPLNCNDSNACTSDSCDALEGCSYVANSNACSDGDACTTLDKCKDKVCSGTLKDCEDGDPCTDDGCDGAGGCTHDQNAAPCDDGNPCTVAGCQGGVCKKLHDRLWYGYFGVAGMTAHNATLDGDRVIAVGTVSPGTSGGGDAFVLAVGIDGKEQWLRQHGGAQLDVGAAVLKVDGGFLVAGLTTSAVPGPGAQAAWLLKVDTLGDQVDGWVDSGDGAQSYLAIAAAGGSGTIAAGYSEAQPCTGRCGLIVQRDASGDVGWSRQLASPGAPAAANASLEGVAAGAEGGFVAVGTATEEGKPGQAGWIVRVSPAGNVLWSQTIRHATSPYHSARAVLAEPEGTFAVAGSAGSGPSPPAGHAAWLVRIDRDGDVLHSATAGGESGVQGRALVRNPGGYGVVCSVAMSAGGLGITGRVFDLVGVPQYNTAATSAAMGWEAVLAVGDASSVVVGSGGAAGSGKTWVSRGDQWGSAYCTPCAGVKFEDCDDGDPCAKVQACTTGTCAKTAPKSDGQACDDGDSCTGNGSCAAGTCKAGAADDCDDLNPCTADSCEAGGCVASPVADGGACAKGGTCANGWCTVDL